MPGVAIDPAELMVPKPVLSGKSYPNRGSLRGHPGEWFLIDKRKYHHRIVKVGPDGKPEGMSYRVNASDFTEAGSTTLEVSIIGQRGMISISARLRERLGLGEGDVVIQREHEGGVLIVPVDLIPRVPAHLAATPQTISTLE